MRNAKATVVAVVKEAVRHGNPCAMAGALLVIVGLCVLFVDQSAAQRQDGMWSDLARSVRPSPLDAVDPVLEGQPVFIAARAQATQAVVDPVFAISADAVALHRQVETYQWIEFEHAAADGRREWRYATDWSERMHASGRFHEPRGHENPQATLASAWFVSPDAAVGPFRIDDGRLLERALEQSRSAVQRAAPATLGDWPRIVTPLPAVASGFVNHGDRYVRASVPQVPSVGDVRVSFRVFPRDYSLAMLGTQRDDRLGPWPLPNGESTLLAAGGAFDAASLVDAARRDAATPSSYWRFAGFGALLLGMAGMFPMARLGLRRMPAFATKPLAAQVAIIVAATLLAGVLAMAFGRGWGWSPIGLLLAAVALPALAVGVACDRHRIGRYLRRRATAVAVPVIEEMPQQVAAAQELLARRRARLAAIRALTLHRAAMRNAGAQGSDAHAPPQVERDPALAAAGVGFVATVAAEPPQAHGPVSAPAPARVANALPGTPATRARQMRQLLDQGIATVVPQSTVVRRCVATRGEWTLNRIARIERSAERIIGFELLRDGVVVKRGSETEVRGVLRESARVAPLHRVQAGADAQRLPRPASNATARAG